MPRSGVPVVSPTENRLLGTRNAHITITVFSDYSCGWCLTFAATLDSLVDRDGDVLIVYRDFVLDSTGPAVRTHVAARCAALQGRFQEYRRAAFETFRVAELPEWYQFAARRAQLTNVSQFDQCMNEVAVRWAVLEEAKLARDYNFSVTPSGFVGAIRFEGALDGAQLDSLIAIARGRGSQ